MKGCQDLQVLVLLLISDLMYHGYAQDIQPCQCKKDEGNVNLNFASGQSSIRYVDIPNRSLVVKTFTRQTDYENEISILKRIGRSDQIMQPVCVLPELKEIAYERALNGDLFNSDLGDLSYQDLIDIVRQVVLAVGSLHDVGILHMDVKPENIVRTGKKVWLIDFGLSCESHRPERKIGTPRTMAPESILPSAFWLPISMESDWWAVGVTIFYIFSKFLRIPDQCHFKQFPYRILYDERNTPVKFEWAPLPPYQFPWELFDLLFGHDGLLSIFNRPSSYKGILQHSLFRNNGNNKLE